MKWLHLVSILTIAGCPYPRTVDCGDLLCPSGMECYHGERCASHEQVAACEGLADGETCEIAGVGLGTCVDGLCLGASCGNGLLDPVLGEVCDDGNRVGGDGCSALCTSNETCGNGFVDELLAETCDEGPANSDAPNAACRTDCVRARCGDGILDDAVEDCDGAALGTKTCADFRYYEGVLACGASCRYAPEVSCSKFCGDDLVNGPDELCDGAPPPASCVDYGFDMGRLECGALTCAIDFSHCRQIGWKSTPSTTSLDLTSVFVLGAGELWATAVNPYSIARFNNGSWSVAYEAPASWRYQDIWAATSTDVYAVGQTGVGGPGLISHFDGSSWTSMQMPPSTVLNAVWGRAGNDVFAAGDRILHYNGTGWTTSQFIPTAPITAIAGTATDVFAGSATGEILHFNGASWSSWASVPSVPSEIHALWAGGSALYVVASATIYRYDIPTKAPTDLRPPVSAFYRDIWASAPDDVFIVGAGSPDVILHYDGQVWTDMELADIPGGADVGAIHGTSPSVVYAVGNNTSIHYEGIGWSRATTALANPVSVHGTDATNVYATLGIRGAIQHFDGLQWGPSYQSPDGSRRDVWTDRRCGTQPPCRVVAVGAGEPANLNATTSVYDGIWNEISTPNHRGLLTVWGSGPLVLAAGGSTSSEIIRLDNGAWVSDGFDASGVRGIWGVDETSVYAVTASPNGSGAIYHRDSGQTWNPMPEASTSALSDVWGSGGIVYAVGASGAIMRRDAVGWTPMTVVRFAGVDLKTVWGTGPDDVFAAGSSVSSPLIVLHYDGVAWSPVKTPPSLTFVTGSWGTPRHFFFAGNELRRLIRTAPP